LPEERIFIPQWYHSTKTLPAGLIIKSGKVEVGSGTYVGAWVSAMRESEYGDYTFCFHGGISERDLMPSHASTRYKRWIGMQTDIPLKTRSYLGMLARPPNKKGTKLLLRLKLQEAGLAHVRLFSHNQVDAIQSHVSRILGQPNLPEVWWSERTRLPLFQEK